MKRCRYCYTENPAESKFCRNCGKELSEAASSSRKKTAPDNLLRKIVITTVSAVALIMGFIPLMEADLPNWLTGFLILLPIGIIGSTWMKDDKS